MARKIARRQFLKTAGVGALAGAALSTYLHASPQTDGKHESKQRMNPPGPKPFDQPWAYTGTDDTAEWQFDLNKNNALPAMIVWLTMTTNTVIQGHDGLLPQFLNDLASATGLTLNCVNYIRNLTTADQQVTSAFQTVAAQFQKIGYPVAQPHGGYNPSSCPGIAEVIAIAQPSLSRAPV